MAPSHARGLSATRFRSTFRERGAGLGTFVDDAKTGAKIEVEVNGWRLRTVIAYNSIPVYNQVVLGPKGKYLYDGISVLSWLGISGQSAWHLAVRGAEELTADQITKAAELFVMAAPDLLPPLT